MSTDLLDQLAEYGAHHRDVQEPVTVGDVKLGVITPVEVGPEPNHPLRRAGAALAAAALVFLLIAIPVMLRGPAEDPAETVVTTQPANVSSTLGATTVPAAESEAAPRFEGYVMVQRLGDDSLAGLRDGSVWRSTDEGQTWDLWHEQDQEIDLMTIAPDGAVVAVRNPNSYNEMYGAGSTVNDTPEIHRWDPDTGSWSVLELARPGLPVADLAPASTDPEDNTCPLGGLQSWVDGTAVVSGDRLVVVGEQRVVGEGICDEPFQFLWTSTDGVSWDLTEDFDLDGHMADLMWIDGTYVGLGSDLPSWFGGGGPVPRVWTSADLASWDEATLDLSVLPDGAKVVLDPIHQASFGGLIGTRGMVGDRFVVELAVLRRRPGLDTSIADLDDLRQWRLDAGLTESPFGDEISLEESLEMDGIDFPLDADEVEHLNNYYDVQEPYGTLTLSTADGIVWETVYTP